jgi:hypothetical protein
MAVAKTSMHLGRVKINKALLLPADSGLPPSAGVVLRELHKEFRWTMRMESADSPDVLQFIGMCTQFDLVQDGDPLPLYDVQVSEQNCPDGTIDYKFTFHKVPDAAG